MTWCPRGKLTRGRESVEDLSLYGKKILCVQDLAQFADE